MKGTDVNKSGTHLFMSFLSEKPKWVFWIAYTVVSGVLFAILTTLMYLMAQQWWIPAIFIIMSGMIWGSFAYNRNESFVYEEKVVMEEV